MAKPAHQYETTVEWTGELRGALSAPKRPVVSIGTPPEFGGTDDVWSPEHLCVAAVNACMMATFLAIATNSKLRFSKYSSTAVGTLEQADEESGPVISRIVVKPRLTIGPDVDRGRAERILRLIEERCYVSNSMTSEVRLEPQIVVE
jgi:organic hydroperoxide reductase OsmC/OhrA